MPAKYLKNEEQKQRAEKVLSMILHKIRKGTATEVELERYRVGSMDLAIYDWASESYQNAGRQAVEQPTAAKMPEPEEVPDIQPVSDRPALKRRAGKFAI